MAHAYTRNGRISVRWKNQKGRKPAWPTTSINPDTGRHFESEDEAEAWGEEMEVLARRGLLPEPDAAEVGDDDITVEDWFERWWPGLDLGLRARGNYAYLFSNHILPEWGKWKLKDITLSLINEWEQRMVKAGYARGGVAAAARTKFGTLLGDAALEGLIDNNPALRPRNRGRRSGVGTGGRGEEKVWATATQSLLIAERLSVLSGRDDEFILGALFAWTGLRWGEAMGLQPKPEHLKLGKLRVDQQLVETGGRFYLLPPKDDSHRSTDLPPFLADLLSRQLLARPGQKCACKPYTVEGQEEQPCGGGLPFVFLGPRLGHIRNSNFARRYFDPASDGKYGTEGGRKRTRRARPVLVNVGEGTVWPGEVWPMYDAVVSGRGTKRYDPEDERVALAEWAPIVKGLSPHGLRHAHSTMLADLMVHEKLRDERMGHLSKSRQKSDMRSLYTHVSDEARTKLKAGLQEMWEKALAERAGFGFHSPVAVLDELLVPFRDGKRKPISPHPSHGKVVAFPTRQVG